MDKGYEEVTVKAYQCNRCGHIFPEVTKYCGFCSHQWLRKVIR
jgi:rRNA maturation endonuclease Nob1